MRSYATLYLGIVVISLLLGLFLPELFAIFSGYSTYILGAIFLITAVQLQLKDIFRQIRYVKTVALVSFVMLLALPVGVYALASQFAPDLAIALMLLAAMPAGMTSPLLTKVAGGEEEFALILAVVTSLLAPLTVPFVVYWTVGSVVEVDVLAIALSLVYVIFVPFAIGEIIKRVWSGAQAFAKKLNIASLALLGLLVAGLVSEEAYLIREQIDDGTIFVPITVLFIFFIALHALGYFTALWGREKLRVASIVSLTYMNFTLAIYLANTFFPEPAVVVPTTLSIIPWALLLAPFIFFYNTCIEKM